MDHCGVRPGQAITRHNSDGCILDHWTTGPFGPWKPEGLRPLDLSDSIGPHRAASLSAPWEVRCPDRPPRRLWLRARPCKEHSRNSGTAPHCPRIAPERVRMNPSLRRTGVPWRKTVKKKARRLPLQLHFRLRQKWPQQTFLLCHLPPPGEATNKRAKQAKQHCFGGAVGGEAQTRPRSKCRRD